MQIFGDPVGIGVGFDRGFDGFSISPADRHGNGDALREAGFQNHFIPAHQSIMGKRQPAQAVLRQRIDTRLIKNQLGSEGENLGKSIGQGGEIILVAHAIRERDIQV